MWHKTKKSLFSFFKLFKLKLKEIEALQDQQKSHHAMLKIVACAVRAPSVVVKSEAYNLQKLQAVMA